MAHSKPPAQPSKRSSNAPPANDPSKGESPPARKTKPPPRRATMEVQMAWLDREVSSEEPASPTPPSSRKKPPRLPGAALTLPPMPITPSKTQRPPPRNTMEVEMNWVELVDDAKRSGAAEAGSRGFGGGAPKLEDEANAKKAKKDPPVEDVPKARRKPIRREED